MNTTPLPMTLDLHWDDELRFTGRAGDVSLALDGDGGGAASPMQAVAFGLAGCMAIDVVHILRKGRHALRSLSARLSAERAAEPPRRFTTIRLHFVLGGDLPAAAVERAVSLSRDKYCSVWHSLRQDMDFATSFEVQTP